MGSQQDLIRLRTPQGFIVSRSLLRLTKSMGLDSFGNLPGLVPTGNYANVVSAAYVDVVTPEVESLPGTEELEGDSLTLYY